jgi:glutamate--cysteine ligase catalytic subunit
MIAGTPDKPFKCSIEELLSIENSLIERRKNIKALLGEGEFVTTLTTFPRLGCDTFNIPNPISKSIYLPDEVIGNHVRFYTLTENIRQRRGSNVDINIPIFKDKNTDPNIDFINMDCMCFGMGCSCLQCTFQIENLETSRYLYDMLAIISPLFLAITAATPILRGYLADTDCRWDVIAQSVDDRTPDEMNKINKSRYDSISYFIGKGSENYNNPPNFEIDKDIDNLLKENDIDPLLAQHLNYIFIRDPLVIYKDGLPINPIAVENTEEGKIIGELFDKYENIHSTNWNTVRLKVPVPGICGWRVEFRPMEIQLSDYDNTSLLIFVNLMIRSILKYKPDWYIPINKVDENMKISQKKDAIINEKLYHKINGEINLFTCKEIGNELVELINKYINEEIDCNQSQKNLLNDYILNLIYKLDGSRKTDAKKMREFVMNHNKYKKDSYVNEEICYDLINKFCL